MRKWSLALALALCVPMAACVQTRQFADVQFTPPSGDYKLLVLRPDVSVGSLTTGGMVEPRADWTEQARTNIVAALRAQQALTRRPGHDHRAPQSIERERGGRAGARGNGAPERGGRTSRSSCTNISGEYLPTKRGRGLDWSLGSVATNLGRKTGYDYALFLHAEDQVASTGRIALGVLGIAGCFVGFCAPNIGGATQLNYASLVDLKTGDVVWFNVVLAKSEVPGIKFGDLRTPQGATQAVDRLLNRMKPGDAVRRAQGVR